MKICVLSNEHFPYRGPDTEVIVNTAAALGTAGADVEFVVPHLGKRQQSCREICAYYNVAESFRLAPLPTLFPPSRSLRIEKLTHAWAGPQYISKRQPDVVLTRDFLGLTQLHRLRLPWCLETYRRHVAEKPWLPRLMRHVDLGRGLGAVAHNNLCREDLIQLGFAEDAVLMARVGIAQTCLDENLDLAAARRLCDLPLDRPVVGFVGSVQNANGIMDVFELATRLPEVQVLVVGGVPQHVARLRTILHERQINNVTLAGHRTAREAPRYLFAADVLFAPAVYKNSYFFNSEWINDLLPRVLPGTPMKLFNYLASGRPVVSADKPEVREILRDGHTALLVPPHDAAAAASAVRRLLADRQLAERLGANGRAEIRQFTWQARGERMLAFFEARLLAKNPALAREPSYALPLAA